MELMHISKFFSDENTPKSGDYNIEQILDTNLYSITKKNLYGIMLSKIYEKPKFPEIQKPDIKYKNSIVRHDTNEELDGFIVIAGNLEPMFQDILVEYIGKKEKNAFYKSSDPNICYKN